MDKKPDVAVIMDRSFTYDLDRSRKRTLPIGWKGTVPAELAEEIEDAGAGRPDPARVPAEAEKPAPKRRRKKKDAPNVQQPATPSDTAGAGPKPEPGSETRASGPRDAQAGSGDPVNPPAVD